MELKYMKHTTEKALKEIALTHGFSKPRFEFSAVAKIGEHFLGDILRCVLTDESNSEKKLHLIVKLPPATEERRNIIQYERFFNRELFMYGRVLPALADFLRSKYILPKDALFPSTARTYVLHDEGGEKMIIMEDLKARGFVMKNRQDGFDERHCRFVLKEMARLHATSLALQRDAPELHDSLTASMPEILFFRGQLSNHMQKCIDKFRVIIDRRFPLGSPIRNKVETFLGDYNNNMKKIVGKNSRLCCINHSDLWFTNMLFKYEKGTDSIEGVCFLDLQISRFCTPVTDIWYFLVSCSRRSTRKAYQDLIACYHESLCSHLRDLGHDPEEVVPMKLLQEELRKYGTYGWAIAIVIMPVILLEVEDSHQLEEKQESGTTGHLEVISDQAEACFTEILEEAEELGFFWD